MNKIIGNENIVNFLDKSVEGGTLAHGYIFYGPKNIGKKTAAYLLASKLLNCEPEKLKLQPDFLEAKIGENNIEKEEVDSLISRLQLSSFSGGYKVLIINHAHLMNRSSANAFLKTLEEPPKKTLILLLTSELGRILPTIISRSSVLQFKLAPKNEIRKFLKERHGVEDTQSYANISFGRPGRAVKLLNTNWQDGHKQAIQEFYKLFFGEYKERFKIVSDLLKEKADKKDRVLKKIDFWIEIVRDVFLMKYKLNDEVAHRANYEMLEKISNGKPIGYFSALAGRLIKMRSLVKNNINIQLM
ncbi:AAA family ATPase, partial [Patescibacteria group bacterium]|nr:AAA family ATPase [Patescibacteria group bacterium]